MANKKIKRININAGHNAPGKKACGATGFLDESKENRVIAKKVASILKKEGLTVFDCTVNNAASQSENLVQIVQKCNSNNVDLNLFIHFNCGVNDKKGDGKTTGTEVLAYSLSGIKKCSASNVKKEIVKLGFKDRGLKTRTDLYVLRKTKDPAILVECCFVDDKDDYNLYDPDKMAQAIAKGILETRF